MNGSYVGTWRIQPQIGDVLQYDDTWISSSHGRPLSLSLPFNPGNPPHRGDAVRTYFENLLPDSKEIRERVARRFKVNAIDAFTLLTEIGRDCVGALQILPEGTRPENLESVNATPLRSSEVAQLLRDALDPSRRFRSSEDDDFRISIAGAQEKAALLWHGGQWCRPHGSTPTTHIFKMPLGLVGNLKVDMSESIENEWLCLEILRAYGLDVANSQPLRFDDMSVLAVERFDRMWLGNANGERWIIRLPQEDMCQATATPPHLKYEADGGPGVAAIMKILATSRFPELDRRTFFQAQVLFWMLAATDGHAKNFSISLHQGGSYQLSPLYDILSAYPIIGTGAHKISPFKVKLAMAVRSKNAHWTMRSILRRHWLALGDEHGVVTADGRRAEYVVDDLVSRTPEVINHVRGLLPKTFPMVLAEQILSGLQTAASKLAT